jgi:hypothetical protein
MTAAATHMAATKQDAVIIEPLRLRKDSGNSATYADKMLAQPTINAILPYRGRMNNTERAHIIKKYGGVKTFFAVMVPLMTPSSRGVLTRGLVAPNLYLYDLVFKAP